MALPVTITGINNTVAPAGPFRVPAGTYAVGTAIDTGTHFTYVNLTGAGTSVGVGQSLTNRAIALTVTSIAVQMSKTGTPTGDVYAEITTTDPTGTVVATSASVAISSYTSGTYVTFTFSSPPTISASATFGVRLRRSVSDAVNYPQVSTSSTGYTGGVSYLYDGTTWTTSTNDMTVIVNGDATLATDSYFFIGRDSTTATTVVAYKSTAPDTSWANVANRPGYVTGIQFITAYQVNNTIHVCLTDGSTTSINHRYLAFDCVVEAFTIAEQINGGLNTQNSTSVNQYGNSIVVRSTGEVVVHYPAARISTFAQTAYRRRISPNGWVAGVAVSTTGVNATNPLVALGASDRLHFLWFNSTNVIQRHLTSANVLGTAASTGATAVALDVATLTAATPNFVGHTAATAFRWTSADNPTVTNATAATGTPVRASDYNSIFYAVYRSSTDSLVYVKSSTDSGATWGAGSIIFSGIAVSGQDERLSRNQLIYLRGGNYVFPYIVSDTGTWKYNEYVVASGVTNYTMPAATGTFTITGNAATFLCTHLPLPAVSGTFTISGKTAALSYPRSVPAVKGTFAITGNPILFRYARLPFPAVKGTFTIAGQLAGLAHGYSVGAVKGTFTIGGQLATLRMARKGVSDKGTFNITGWDSILAKRSVYVLPTVKGTYAITGRDANLIKTGVATNYPLTADRGTFTISGKATAFRADRKMVAVKGTFTISGKAAGFFEQYGMRAFTGTYAISGKTAILTYGIKKPGKLRINSPMMGM